MTAPAAVRKESTALALTAGNLPDLSKPENLVRFAALFSGDQLSKLDSQQQAVFLTTLGNHLGVRAELGEIMLYQGKPYITIDGRIRISHRSGLLNGIEAVPASSMECNRYGIKDGEHLWKCLVWKKGSSRSFVGWGHVRNTDRNPVSKTHPQEMAKKRAKYDALRLAFPPNEEITPLHDQYIQEAEVEAARTRAVSGLTGSGVTAAGYDDDPDSAPDDDIVLTEEIGATAAPTAAAVDDTPLLEDEQDLSTMTLEQAIQVDLVGPPGSWNGQAGRLLNSFSTSHIESIKKWSIKKVEEKGEDRELEKMATACTLILEARAKDQENLDLLKPPVSSLTPNEAKPKAEGKGLPF